jgi:hypothetical protein
MHGTFTGPAESTWHHDHGRAALEREDAERRKRQEREDRAEIWLADRMVGLTFYSFAALESAAHRTYETLVGRECTPDERQILSNAARSCWAGVTMRARTKLEIGPTGHVESLLFWRAA